MASDALGFSGFRDHEQLGQNGNRFQIDRECPENLKSGKFVVDKNCQTSDRNDYKFNSEGIMVVVVRCLELKINEVDCCQGACYKYNLHCGVIDGDERSEEIEISG